jgi:spore coat polysaccharide biosynthesis protein SpsF
VTMSKVAALIQARSNSTRLPGKILLDFGPNTVLKAVVDRVKYSKKVDEVLVVTSFEKEDDVVEAYCKTIETNCYRGPLHDVLARFYQAAISCGKPQVIVRITADCPFVDPSLIDSMLSFFEDSNLDYLANSAPPPGTFPDGLDVEIFTFKALQRAHLESFLPSDREHVTFYFWKSGLFKTLRYDSPEDNSEFRFTIDYPEDYRILRNIYEEVCSINPMFNLDLLLQFVKQNNSELPSAALRNSGWESSEAKDQHFLSNQSELD